MKKTIFILLSFFFLLQSCASKRKVTKTIPPAKASEAGIKNKYAFLLGVKAENISNTRLYSFVDEWIDVPYKYAGKDKKGVDCSGITSLLLGEVYGKKLSGPSYSMYDFCSPVAKTNLMEGDLVFFKIESEKISHVGVYLQNNKFIHATVKSGVIISNLEEAYYANCFFSGGRPK